jgi:hypothetical protein
MSGNNLARETTVGTAVVQLDETVTGDYAIIQIAHMIAHHLLHLPYF